MKVTIPGGNNMQETIVYSIQHTLRVEALTTMKILNQKKQSWKPSVSVSASFESQSVKTLWNLINTYGHV